MQQTVHIYKNGKLVNDILLTNHISKKLGTELHKEFFYCVSCNFDKN